MKFTGSDSWLRNWQFLLGTIRMVGVGRRHKLTRNNSNLTDKIIFVGFVVGYHAISLEVRYAFDEHDKIGIGILHNLQQNNFFRYGFYVLRPLCPKGHEILNLWVIIY